MTEYSKGFEARPARPRPCHGPFVTIQSYGSIRESSSQSTEIELFFSISRVSSGSAIVLVRKLTRIVFSVIQRTLRVGFFACKHDELCSAQWDRNDYWNNYSEIIVQISIGCL